MNLTATIEVFSDGWHAAAVVEQRGDPALGIGSPTVAAYVADYGIEHLGRRDAAALSWALPVGLETYPQQRWPAFLVDLLPQGYGREELLRQLGLPETAGASADWRLLLSGAGNPIGHLRVKEAHDWLAERMPQGAARGFTMEEVAARSEDFAEFLASHGLFVAGSSGVQGEWPKILLTEGRDGLFYLDHSLPDAAAARHWLVKFGRGPNAALAAILRQEAPYMELARHLGLRVHGRLVLRDSALFVPRFDRSVNGRGVLRIAQESIASLCGLAEFGAAPSHNIAVRQLAAAATGPEREVAEFVKRDIANVVLGNKDNHARNMAIQRHADGAVRLAPVFDFAPMLLHPDGIARRMRWERNDGGAPQWQSVIEQCREATGMPLTTLPGELREVADRVAGLPAEARRVGLDPDLIARLTPGMNDTARQLEAL